MPRLPDPKELLKERLCNILSDEDEISACLARAPDVVRAESGDPRFIVDGKRTTLSDLARRLSGREKHPRQQVTVIEESGGNEESEGDDEQIDVARIIARLAPLPASADIKPGMQAQSKFEMLRGMHHDDNMSVDKLMIAHLIPPGAVSNPVAVMKYHAPVVSTIPDRHSFLSSDDMLKMKRKLQLILHPDKHQALCENDRKRPAEICNTLNASREWAYKHMFLYKPSTPSPDDEEQSCMYMEWEAWDTDNSSSRVFHEYQSQLAEIPTVQTQALRGLSHVLDLCKNQQDRLQEITADYNGLVGQYNELRHISKANTDLCIAEIDKWSARLKSSDSNRLRALEGRVKKTKQRLQDILMDM